MAINFPDTTGQPTNGTFTYTDIGTGNYYVWNGTSWTSPGINAATAITVAGGILLTDLSIGSVGSASGLGNISYNSNTGVFSYVPPDLSAYAQTTSLAAVASSGSYTDLSDTPTLPTVTLAPANGYGVLNEYNFGSSRLLYTNVWDTVNDLPSAASYHGMFVHVHTTGKAYYAHSGQWTELSTVASLTDLGIADGFPNQVLTTDGAGNFSFEDAQGSGSSYNQSLNTTDEVSFLRVTADDFVKSGTGPYVISSASYTQIDAQDGVRVTGLGAFRLPNLSTVQRDLLLSENGDMIYNTTANKLQAYQNGAWINIEDGSTA
jgi:hypothetical protein